MKRIKKLLTVLFLCTASIASAQNIKVTGTVTDADEGSALMGAYVRISGVNTGGVMTDQNGFYSISCPSNAILVFSLTGYDKQEIA